MIVHPAVHVPTPAAAAAARPPLPVQADSFQRRMAPTGAVRGADLSTYRRTLAGAGAAVGAFSSHFVAAGLGIWAGSALAGALGFGPVGAVVGAAIGAAAAVKVQFKTWMGREIGARLGALAGDYAGKGAYAAGLPLPGHIVETTRNFSYTGMREVLDDVSHNSHPRISLADAQAFVAALKPGDVVLTNDEASTPFALATLVLTGHGCDFTHGIVHTGGGKTVEARMKGGVQEGDLIDVLTRKHHAVALRPHYQPGQAEAVVAAAKDMVGKPYDFKFKMGNDSFYCSEAVYETLKKGAPQLEFKSRPVLNREVIVPSDLLRTKDADVVAEAGVGRTMFDAYLAKLVP